MKRVGWMVVAAAVLGVPGRGQDPVPPSIQPFDAQGARATQAAFMPERNTPLFRDLDLLRRTEFARSTQASVSVRVADKQGNAATRLAASDFVVVVNGTPRVARLQPQGTKALSEHLPYVLLVFPPNQATIHYVATKDAISYFGGFAGPALPWKVGIFDANGSFLPFTNDKGELLVNLEAVERAKEPLQFSGYGYLGHRNGPWLDKVDTAIASMERSDGPRIVIAMNPLGVNQYGMNEAVGAPLERVGPEELVGAAERVGAHIYVDNAGGPEPIIPGGQASTAPSWRGTRPSGNQRIEPAQTAALNYSAYTTSMTMQTARATLGGFANGFKDLSAEIDRDLALAHVLEFDLTLKDRDMGVPRVEVTAARPGLRMAMVDLIPLHTATESTVRTASRMLAAKVLQTAGKPVGSPEFRILQRVEYFPVRAFSGGAPFLPMSATVEWTGQGARPAELSIAESVMDMDLKLPLLERAIETEWAARTVRWERDGQLHPGHYAWLVAVHDANGKVLASARRSFSVAYPAGQSVMVSSLVTGATCHADALAGGLRRRPAPGTRDDTVHLTTDPLEVGGCHVVPDPADRFAASDTLHALVRIYPGDKLAKELPEAWTGRFILRSAAGVVESDTNSAFSVDPGSGLLASTALPLSQTGIHPGPHVLEFSLQGPGIRQTFRESRAVTIGP